MRNLFLDFDRVEKINNSGNNRSSARPPDLYK